MEKKYKVYIWSDPKGRQLLDLSEDEVIKTVRACMESGIAVQVTSM